MGGRRIRRKRVVTASISVFGALHAVLTAIPGIWIAGALQKPIKPAVSLLASATVGIHVLISLKSEMFDCPPDVSRRLVHNAYLPS